MDKHESCAHAPNLPDAFQIAPTFSNFSPDYGTLHSRKTVRK